MAKSNQSNLAALVNLFHRGYAVPLIACLQAEQGAKFVTLVHRLAASRDAVATTLKYLMATGIVVRNAGYGHPMRPEYLLAPASETLGAVCMVVVELVDRLGIADIAFRKWPMPVTVAVGRGANRFSGVMASLPGLTPRALTGALRDLDRVEVVARDITEDWPPHPVYELAESGELLLPSLERLGAAAANV